jgi:hypothetical protein
VQPAYDSALDFFDTYYEPARRHQEGMASEWSGYEAAYFGEPEGQKPTGSDSWRSWFFYKYAFQQVKTLVAELAADELPTFVWEARRPEQDDYADIVQSLIGFMLQRDGYNMKRVMAIETAAVYGGCPVKVHWTYKTVRRTRMGAAGPITEEYVVLDQPTMTLIDPRDFMYDTRARTMSECRYAFHRMRLTLDELKAKKRSDGSPFYKNLDELEDFEGGGGDGGDSRDLDNDFSGEREKARTEGIEVVEMWTRDRWVVRANGNVIILDEANPFWHGRLPFEVITLLPSRNDVWGQSVVWTVQDVQAHLHTLDNASMDALKLGIDPPLAVSLDDPENMNRAVAPGARFAGTSGVKEVFEPLRLQGIDPYVSENAIGAARNQMEYISGITREMAGQSNAGTATQAALNQRQAKGRVGVMLRSIDDSFARIAEMFLQLCQQFLDLSQPVKVLGQTKGSAWTHIAPQQIAGLWDVRPKNSSERVAKELRLQNLMEGLSSLMPGAGITSPSGKSLDLTPVYEEIAENLGLPVDRVVVDAQQARDERAEDIIAEGQAQAQVQQAMAPPEQPAAPEPSADEKIVQSISYDKLPDAAQAALLEKVGLPSDGVEDDNRNPTRPNAGKPDPMLTGHQAGGQAFAETAAEQPA